MFGRRTDEKLELLREVPIFSALETRQLEAVGRHVDRATRAAGDVLMRQGERAEEMMLILSGAATVERDGNVLATLGRNDVVGELALIDREPRTATVTATEDCELLVMHHRDFAALMDEVPDFARNVLISMAHRLRAADELLTV